MSPDLDCTFFVSRIPEITFDEGMFRISFEIGTDARFEVVLPPHVFLASRRCAAKAVADFEARGEIVDMRAEH